MKVVIRLKTNMNIILSNKYENHKDFIFIKNKLQGICMIYPKLTICIHIPTKKKVHNSIYMKASDSRGTHVYLLVLDKYSIYMKIGKTCINERIIKTRLYMRM